jgi:hypothetical protein
VELFCLLYLLHGSVRQFAATVAIFTAAALLAGVYATLRLKPNSREQKRGV